METLHKDSKKQIGQFVADDFRTAAIFSRYGIDFCCKGDRTIEEVCKKNVVSVHFGQVYWAQLALFPGYTCGPQIR